MSSRCIHRRRALKDRVEQRKRWSSLLVGRPTGSVTGMRLLRDQDGPRRRDRAAWGDRLELIVISASVQRGRRSCDLKRGCARDEHSTTARSTAFG